MQSFPPDLEEFVQQALASGRYRSADEVVYDALRLLREREMRLEELRRDIQVGWDQVDRGEVILLDDEAAEDAFYADIMRRGRQRLSS